MQRWGLCDGIQPIVEQCIDCGLCSKECDFLQQYGTPLELAEVFLKGDGEQLAYSCSLCGLCKAVCPESLDPSLMFRGRRNEEFAEKGLRIGSHLPLRIYERVGLSPLFSWYGLPEDCTTIYFPGCSLPGRRPERVLDVYRALQRSIPRIGLTLDCCSKPSHDLGDPQAVSRYFSRMIDELLRQGIHRVVVNCPSCYAMFHQYGKDMEVQTVYSVFAEHMHRYSPVESETVTIHDPCSIREFEEIQQDVRTLVLRLGLKVEEMEHQGATTLCCGEGAGVGFVDGQLSGKWGLRRKQEAGGRKIITYCGGCTTLLERVTPTFHILDLLFDPAATLGGLVCAKRPPFTYISRVRLKGRLHTMIRPRSAGRRTWQGRLTFRGR